MISPVLNWIASSHTNTIIAVVLAALVGAQIATVITINVVQDTTEPPIWMQKEKAKMDALRQYNLDSWKKMTEGKK